MDITTKHKIQIFDLEKQYIYLKDELDNVIRSVARSGMFVSGPEVTLFEQEFAKYQNTKYCVGTSSGTSSLSLALSAANIGSGDEVITQTNSFIATAEAIKISGATPVLIDVDERSYAMDIEQLRSAITPKTRAIIPVHLYGQIVALDSIILLANEHSILIIEDAAQAHGAEYKGSRAGELTDSACFSFYPTKNLGAFGDAGALVTNNEELAKKAKILSDHGRIRSDYSTTFGYNERLDSLQAAVLRIKLKHLDKWNNLRRHWASRLNDILKDTQQVVTPMEFENSKHVYHLYVIQAEQRDELASYLNLKGISTGIHYRNPIHKQGPFIDSYPSNKFPIADRLSNSILSLPMYPELTEEEVVIIGNTIKSFYS